METVNMVGTYRKLRNCRMGLVREKKNSPCRAVKLRFQKDLKTSFLHFFQILHFQFSFPGQKFSKDELGLACFCNQIVVLYKMAVSVQRYCMLMMFTGQGNVHLRAELSLNACFQFPLLQEVVM